MSGSISRRQCTRTDRGHVIGSGGAMHRSRWICLQARTPPASFVTRVMRWLGLA